jgi:gamma-butyrobetaine dioxygenase
MNIANVDCARRSVTITWQDRSITEYPFIWLRDSDPDAFHPDARERVFDLTDVDIDIRPQNIDLAADGLIIRWPDKDRSSTYSGDWLYRHRPGVPRRDPASVGIQTWDAASLREIPRVQATECERSADTLLAALGSLKRFGLLIVEGLDDATDAGERFGDLIGFKRETNFGVTFDVVSKPEPNNLAYTSIGLPLHTDLPNQEAVPGYQFLHSYRNDASGGESVFADGFRIVADMRRLRPDEYDILCRTPVPFRFRDTDADIRQHRPIISQSDNGTVCAFAFNAAIADVPDMSADVLHDFYRAYRNLMIDTRRPDYALRLSLCARQMVIFDNTRILHGRTAFDPASGDRRFRGYYIEKNEVDSRMRVLARRSENDAPGHQEQTKTDRGE